MLVTNIKHTIPFPFPAHCDWFDSQLTNGSCFTNEINLYFKQLNTNALLLHHKANCNNKTYIFQTIMSLTNKMNLQNYKNITFITNI